ncbi:paralysed flagella protein A [Campylobacter subantarcticus LMG 24377]|uniref:Tetratricopeptide repeat protein n=1 Tax=Campylobacter subantarcticus TaxID=497724 RepID=A0ABW9N562_9BACT|nr:tetratricopeptide repeat protein [Campylobacter subantarcticus]AJC93206.1 paralysed flagella protein A [Campylobacter subantarcticus LMG 24377]EAL3938776.1 flagellar protein [Campylobacter lari]MPB99384.1 tetratricopeptide repeat protein [Campylobacter subantarcticus]
MLRFLFLFLLSISYVFSFEIVVNQGEEHNRPFTLLHLKDNKEFTCKSVFEFEKIHFECNVLGVSSMQFQNKEFDDFSIFFEKHQTFLTIKIYPKILSKMFSYSQDIFNAKEIESQSGDQSKHFVFIFTKDLRYFKPSDGLNFDIYFDNALMPYIGALDLNSNPIETSKSADFNTYFNIKQEYEAKKYDQVLRDATNAVKRYQGSVFMNEFELYKLRVQNKLFTYELDKDQQVLEQMLGDAKKWLRTYINDKDYTEVMYIMMRIYMGLSQRSNVEYIIDTLNTEHKGDKYTIMALLDYADYLYHLGKKNTANNIYQDVYYSTPDADLASRAALFLARNYLEMQNVKEAKELVSKILDSNPQFFMSDLGNSLLVARAFSNNRAYDISSKIYEYIFTHLSKVENEYERVLKDLALSLLNANEHTKAQKYLDLYAEEFPLGEFLSLIKEAQDKNFLYLKDTNASFLHQRYEEIMQKYAGEIASKALFDNVELYFQEKNYEKVVAYQKDIEKYSNKEIKKLLEQAAILVLDQKLKNDECLDAVKIYEDFKAYNIGSKIQNKKRMLECFKRTTRMEEAKKYIIENENDDIIFYKLQSADLALKDKNYQNAIKMINDILNTRTIISDNEKFEANYIKFFAELKLQDYNAMIRTLQKLEQFPMNYRMVELYYEFLRYCERNNFITSILTYAPKAIDYQNLIGVNLFSPDLEFIYIKALRQSNQAQKALTLFKDLLANPLKDDERAHTFYMQSNVYEDLNQTNQQRQSLQKCLDINATSNWQNLCKDKLNVLNTQP